MGEEAGKVGAEVEGPEPVLLVERCPQEALHCQQKKGGHTKGLFLTGIEGKLSLLTLNRNKGQTKELFLTGFGD